MCSHLDLRKCISCIFLKKMGAKNWPFCVQGYGLFQFLGISKNREKVTLKSIFWIFFTQIVNLDHIT